MLWRFSFLCWTIHRGESRTAATSKMERFVITVNSWKPLTIITKLSISDVAAVLDPPLSQMINAMVYLWSWNNSTYMTILLIPYFLLQVWKTVILDLEKTCLFHSKTVINPKKIVADISILFDYSVLYWHVVKYKPIFVTASISNLQSFVRVFFKTLIVFSMQLM